LNDTDTHRGWRPQGAEAETPGVAYGGVGAALRAERERHGLSVEQVAEVLRIQPRYIEAIEQGRFAQLPGTAYAIGFVKTYGRYFGFDVDALVAVYKQEAAGLDDQPRLYLPTPIEEARRPGLLVVLVGLLVAAGVYAAWVAVERGPRELLDLIPEPPARLLALLQPGEREPPPSADGAVPSTPAPVVRGAPEAAVVVLAPPPVVHAAPETAQPSAPPRPEAAPAPMEAPSAALAEIRRDVDAVRDLARARLEREAAMSRAMPPGTQPVPPGAAAAEAEARAEVPPAPTPRVPGAASLEAAFDPARAIRRDVLPEAPATSGPLPPAAIPSAPAVALPPHPVPEPPAGQRQREPQVYGQANASARVVLRATADAWIQVQGPRDELLMTRILRPGDVYMVPDRGDLVLMTGNAGGLEVRLDGQSLGLLGAPGAVRRDIPLEPERLRQAIAR